jgi:hypothetical protein
VRVLFCFYTILAFDVEYRMIQISLDSVIKWLKNFKGYRLLAFLLSNILFTDLAFTCLHPKLSFTGFLSKWNIFSLNGISLTALDALCILVIISSIFLRLVPFLWLSIAFRFLPWMTLQLTDERRRQVFIDEDIVKQEVDSLLGEDKKRTSQALKKSQEILQINYLTERISFSLLLAFFLNISLWKLMPDYQTFSWFFLQVIQENSPILKYVLGFTGVVLLLDATHVLLRNRKSDHKIHVSDLPPVLVEKLRPKSEPVFFYPSPKRE